MKSLQELATEIHAENVAAGWWTNVETGESILETRNRGEMLMLSVTELAEAWDAGEEKDDKLTDLPGLWVELADFAIRACDQLGAAIMEYEAWAIRWEAFQAPKRLMSGSHAEKIMTLVSMTALAMEHWRKGHRYEYAMNLSASIAYAFMLAELLGFNLLDVMDAKRAYNRERPDHKLEARAKDGGKKV